MTDATSPPAAIDAQTAELIAALREIVSALDRRMPHLERPGEAQIAADAARLRASAVRHIEQLLGGAAGPVPGAPGTTSRQ